MPRPFIDLTGKVFGSLTAIERGPNLPFQKRSYTTWLAVCICGKQRTVAYTTLLKSASTCNCKRVEILRYSKDRDDILTSSIYTRMRWNCLRNRRFNLEVSQEYLQDLMFKQKGICKISGLHIGLARMRGRDSTASLDRIDSSLGYIEGNVQWVHKRVNTMKNNMTDQELIEWCRLIAEHNK